MTSVVDSEESEVVYILESAISLPFSEVRGLELFFLLPVEFISPFLTTSPVAYEILVAGVDEHWDFL
jgi:hypothetical protein